MNVLVTGGAGYIGSHVCVDLIQNGYTPIILDNLETGSKVRLGAIERITGKRVILEIADLKRRDEVKNVFNKWTIDAVIHLAGNKSIEESIHNPLKYYINNVVGTLNLLSLCNIYKVERVIFSSSATVYGHLEAPVAEDMVLPIQTNPYANTKLMIENILKDYVKATENVTVTILRYFNPIGAHPSGEIGEMLSNASGNLMPHILMVAKKQKNILEIFGNNYCTKDGTAVRDFIHVCDLASGHVACLRRREIGYQVYNLGTGCGTSVLELVKTFEKVNSVSIPYTIVGRREGDIERSFADVTKANTNLGWITSKTIDEMCRDAWNYEKKSEMGVDHGQR